MRKFIICLLLLLVACHIHAQPTQEHVEYYSEDWKRTTKDSADFYRVIRYDKDGKPKGTVRDFYISGELQWEGALLTTKPDTMVGVNAWYDKRGYVTGWGYYEDGERMDIGKFIHENGYRYSPNIKLFLRYLNRQLPFRLKPNAEGAYVIHRVGTYLYRRKIYMGAFHFWDQGKIIREKLGLDSDLSKSLNNLGLVHAAQGHYNQALDHYQRAAGIQSRYQQYVNLATTFNNIGKIHYRRGEYDKALKMFARSAKLRKKYKRTTRLAQTFTDIGHVYFSLRQFNRAVKYYKEAEEIQLKKDKTALALSWTLYNLGNVYRARGLTHKALDYHFKALGIRRRKGKDKLVGSSLVNIAEVYIEQKDWTEALEYLERAETIYKGEDDQVKQIRILYNKGRIYAGRDKYGKALNYLMEAANRCRELGLEQELVKSLAYAGLMYKRQGDLNKALPLFTESIELEAKIYPFLPPIQSMLDELPPYVYQEAVSCAIEEGKVRQAFHFASHFQNRQSHDFVLNSTIITDSLSTDMKEEEIHIRSRLVFLENQLRDPLNIELRDSLMATKRATLESWGVFKENAMEEAPVYTSYRYPENHLNIVEVQQSLDSAEAMVSFFGGEDLYAFVATESKYEVFELGRSQDIYALAENFERSYRSYGSKPKAYQRNPEQNNPDPEVADSISSERLYENIWKPFGNAAWLTNKDFHIMGNHKLGGVDFTSLLKQNNDKNHGHAIEYYLTPNAFMNTHSP